MKSACIITETDFSDLPLVMNSAVMFNRKGCSVDIFCKWERSVCGKGNNDITVKPIKTVIDFDLSRYLLLRVLGRLEFLSRLCLRTLRKRYDIYIAVNIFPLFCTAILRFFKKRGLLIYHNAEFLSIKEAKGQNYFYKRFEMFYSKRATAVICSEETRANLLMKENRLKFMPLVVLNCLLKRPLERCTLLKDIFNKKGIGFEKVVFYLGGISSSSCIEEIISSVRYWKDGYVFAMLGLTSEDFLHKMKYLIEELGLESRIQYLGKVRQEELFRYVMSADLGLSFYRGDNFNIRFCSPNKIFQYMMGAIPVIGSNQPLSREVILGSRCGFCIEPDQPQTIADAVNSMFEDGVRYRQFCRNSYSAYMNKYNFENQYKKVFDKLAKGYNLN